MAIETLLAGSNEKGDVLASPQPSPSNHAVRTELAQALERARARLPEHYRRVIAWRPHEELSWEEIGWRMQCTPEASRKVWSRAFEQLRRELAEHGPFP
ncbi:MAG: RNA polymerase sigma factor [Isosphaeraceae bacterium]